MGGVIKALFGGSDSSSSSGNKAWNVLSSILGGTTSTGSNALSSLSSQLGSFDDYKKNSGFDYTLNKGERATTGSGAANGLMNSGATATALSNLETNLGNQTYNNYLSQLSNVAQMGLGTANTLTSAGATSKSSGSSSNGILTSLFG